MAILTSDKRDVQSSGNFETTGFKVQASAKAFEILSDKLYKYKVRAVIREYSCNAYDAHVESRCKEQFKVHLPTTFEPWFSVRDFGFGLSEHDVREIFTTYFASTKTHTNDMIGGLGLGSKAAFCIVDSFSVTSWYDGVKSVYNCYKDENGEPQCAKLTSSVSEDPNGIEIKMSIDGRESEFEDEAVEVFQYFDDVPFINNPEVVENINKAKEDYQFVDDDMCLSSCYGSTKAVMGNVAYNIPDEYNSLNCEGYLKFDIGELSFAASREELSLDDSTIASIRKRMTEAKEKIGDIVKAQLDDCDSLFAKAELKNKINNGALRSMLKGVNLDDYNLPSLPDRTIIQYSKDRWYRSGVEFTEKSNLPFGENVRYFEFKPRFKTRIIEYLRQNSGQHLVLLKSEHIDLFEIPKDRIEDLDIVIPKISRSGGGTGTQRSKVALWNGKGSGWRDSANECWNDAEVDNDGKERVYLEIYRYETVGSQWNVGKLSDVKDSLEHLGIKCPNIYGLKSAFLNTKSFKAGNWISLDDYIKRETHNLPNIEVQKGKSEWTNLFKDLSKQVDSDVLNSFVDIVQQTNDDHSDKFAYETLRLTSRVVFKEDIKTAAKEVLKAYPVLKLLSYSGQYADQEQIKACADYIMEKESCLV